MQVNDFVTIPYITYKAIAYIVELTDSYCKVVKVYYEYPTGKRERYKDLRVETVQRHQVKLMETKVYKEDVQALIDMSLDRRDEGWFKELNKRGVEND